MPPVMTLATASYSLAEAAASLASVRAALPGIVKTLPTEAAFRASLAMTEVVAAARTLAHALEELDAAARALPEDSLDHLLATLPGDA